MNSPLPTAKFFALTACFFMFCSVLVCAAPAKRPQWEYATVDFTAHRPSGNSLIYGAELILPGKKAIFLEAKDAHKANYKTYLLNRLGAQGWELASSPGDRYDRIYIFKRQK